MAADVVIILTADAGPLLVALPGTEYGAPSAGSVGLVGHQFDPYRPPPSYFTEPDRREAPAGSSPPRATAPRATPAASPSASAGGSLATPPAASPFGPPPTRTPVPVTPFPHAFGATPAPNPFGG